MIQQTDGLNKQMSTCVIGVLPREIAQAVIVPTTLALRSWVGDVGKELPRVEPVNVCPLLGRTGP